MTKRKRKTSLVAICIVHFIIYSLAVGLIILVMAAFINDRLVRQFPDMSDFLSEYEDDLKTDDFDSINMNRFSRSDLIVLDEDYQLLYTSDSQLASGFDKDDLVFINDYYADRSFNTYSYVSEEDGRTYTVVLKFDRAKDEEKAQSYCVLDEDLNIISGSLFGSRTSLSETEFELISGSFKKDRMVQRYDYTSSSGEARSLLFFSPMFDTMQYERTTEKIERLWYLMIPAILVLIVANTVLLIRRVRKSIEPIRKSITAYGHGQKVDTEGISVPQEFEDVLDSFEKMTERIDESEARAEKARLDQRRVLADLSHDIRTPLTVISGYAGALADHVIPEQSQDIYLQVICDRSKSVQELTETLMDYTKMDHPEFTADPVRTDICEYAREYLAEKYPEIETGGFELDPDIPDEPVYADIDVSMFRRVFENIISNSMRNNAPGTCICFMIREEEKDVVIGIGDRGKGIPEKLKETIFEPFVSGNKARTAGGGVGLGLSIVRRIVQLHNGTICLAGEPENGMVTEFVIRLAKSGIHDQK